jgi:hypothetical protein
MSANQIEYFITAEKKLWLNICNTVVVVAHGAIKYAALHPKKQK